jgi:hypothetical protein
MGSAGWAAFPDGTKLELKEPTHAGGDSPQAHLLDRADRYCRTLILGQTMTGATMTSGKGGQAFGTVEAQLKQDRLEAASSFVADIFNQQLIPSILRRNYGDDDEAPLCRFLQENEGTYQDAERDKILVDIGLPIPVSHLRKKYSIPEPEGDEEVLPPQLAVTVTPSVEETAAEADKPQPRPTVLQQAAQGQPVAEQQQARGQEKQKQVQARLERIAKINDDEIFGREIKKLASELVAQEERWVTIDGNPVLIGERHSMIPKSDSKGNMPNGEHVSNVANEKLGLADLRRKAEFATGDAKKALEAEVAQRTHELTSSTVKDLSRAEQSRQDQALRVHLYDERSLTPAGRRL